MVSILAIDTVSINGSVALIVDNTVYSQKISSLKHNSEELLPAIATLVEVHGGLEQLSAIATNIGPGSLTGIRLGITCAKLLAFSLNKPVIAINALYALARNMAAKDEVVTPIIDAKMQQCYSASYKLDSFGVMQEIVAPHMIDYTAATTSTIDATHIAKLAMEAYLNGQSMSPFALKALYIRGYKEMYGGDDK